MSNNYNLEWIDVSCLLNVGETAVGRSNGAEWRVTRRDEKTLAIQPITGGPEALATIYQMARLDDFTAFGLRDPGYDAPNAAA